MKLPSLKQAVALHFAVSLVAFTVLVALMMRVWFPGDLFFIDGGWQGLKIIAPIDLVLGPALTLLFYRPHKKGIAFDISAILFVQVAALSYGVYVAHEQRPAAIVFAEHRFETLSYSEFKLASKEIEKQQRTPKPLSEFGQQMPIIVYANPYGADDYGQYLEELLNGLPELRERSDRYRPIETALADIEKYRVVNDKNGTTIEVPASGKSEKSLEEHLTFPLKARYQNGNITFSKDGMQLLGIERRED